MLIKVKNSSSENGENYIQECFFGISDFISKYHFIMRLCYVIPKHVESCLNMQ